MSNTKSIFEARIQEYQTQATQLTSKIEKWSWIRGITFAVCIIDTYFSSKNYGNGIAIAVFVISFGAFLYTVSTHLKLAEALKKLKIFIQVNENEIDRLENKLFKFADGAEYIEKNHFYASDLDLFGKHSLFQLINRCHTFAGKALLAAWMKAPANKNTIIERQIASLEISNDIDFRQQLEVLAMNSEKVSEPINAMLHWVQSPESESINKPIFKFGQYLPIVTSLVLVGAILGFYTYYFVGLMVLLQGIILKMIDKEVGTAFEQTEQAAEPLKPYAEMMQLIVDKVNKSFISEKLKDLSAKINSAPQAVNKLQKIIHQLSYRSNPVAALGGMLFMFDLRNFINLEKWKANYKVELPIWIDVVSEFESINSLAGHQFAIPENAIPVISEEKNLIKTESLSHPLIHSNNRVPNDFATEGLGVTIILTGSNMSGKSTFERTIGINLVLTMMGAVATARYFECSTMQLFTSMRTQDSLENDTSSFYAELKRLEILISFSNAISLKQNTTVFYLLDEILKGTNSKDRHSGAKALILQLKNKAASGIISTHDVELGDEFEGQAFIKNYSFASEMVGEKLVFDYKLKQGVCHSFNATELMRRIGIEVAP